MCLGSVAVRQQVCVCVCVCFILCGAAAAESVGSEESVRDRRSDPAEN